MRLIDARHLVDNRGLRCETFDNDAERPKYAILSHRWVDKQEVTLQEFVSGQARHKFGWRKIQFCCEEAVAHNLDWVWIDTCCIDKSSSAELIEAINSMYRWYGSVRRCFAYMHDTDKFSEESFRKSDWFKRSWTLQQLLAPDSLWFYDAAFRYIGSKRQKTTSLQSITSVPADVLEDPDRMYKLPIAQRMSWAANRKATRVEDIAYSLFGIFEVNLPLLYGEGTRAFARLQQEIIRNSDDQSIFWWNSPGHDNCPCFAASPADFSLSGSLSRSEISATHDDPELNKVRPYTLTNIGLRIECKIIQYRYPIWLAFLPFAAQFDGPIDSDEKQCAFFLLQDLDQREVFHRVKVHNHASCTLEEAIDWAYGCSFWVRLTDQGSKKAILNHLGLFENSGHNIHMTPSNAHWRTLYIKLEPHSSPLRTQDLLHGIVLDMPSLSPANDSTRRSFALVSNFDWDVPSSFTLNATTQNGVRSPKDYEEHHGREIKQRLVGKVKDPSKRSPVTVPWDVLAQYPLQPGLAGILFFEPPRLDLKAIVLGFDKDFQVTGIFVTEDADVDFAKLYWSAFRFVRMNEFKNELGSASQSRASQWLKHVMDIAFEGHDEKELPNQVFLCRLGLGSSFTMSAGKRRLVINVQIGGDGNNEARRHVKCRIVSL